MKPFERMIGELWDDSIVPTLCRYIEIPNKSPMFDAEWQTHGYMRDAVKLLDTLQTDFEYEGEMGPDVALNHEMQAKYYPFSRLTGPANILVMPGLQSANISSKLLKALGGEIALGPYLMGLSLPVQIAPMSASSSDLVTLAVLAGGGADAIRKVPARQKRA